jgi:hypothetical protein
MIARVERAADLTQSDAVGVPEGRVMAVDEHGFLMLADYYAVPARSAGVSCSSSS